MPTYHLPGGARIRVASARRFVLIRDFARTGHLPTPTPYIERRSDRFDTLARLFRPASDYLLDQVTGTVRYRVAAGSPTTEVSVVPARVKR